jgi:hypothetical protein
VQALLSALLAFALQVRGFTNRQLRKRVAALHGRLKESRPVG